jgi:hypothetical protein
MFLEVKKCFLCYVDPGSGSLILQMLIASFVGAAALFRRSIFESFSKKKKGDSKETVCKRLPEVTPDGKSD